MPTPHLVAAAAAAFTLLLPAAAHGHAWSGTRTLTSNGASPVADMSRSGHAIVGWRIDGGSGGAVAIAAPGSDFGAAQVLDTPGPSVQDVAIADNGDAFAAGSTDTGIYVAVRRAGDSTWRGWQQLPGASGSFDLAAGADGNVIVVTGGSPGLRTYRRSDPNTFSQGPTGTTALSPLYAGCVGTRVVVAGRIDQETHGLVIDGDTVGAPDRIDTVGGSPNMRFVVDRAGAGAVLSWQAYDGWRAHMRAATAGSDGAFGDGQDVSGTLNKGVMHPDGAIASDGRILVGWGDAHLDPVSLIAAPSPGAAFAPTTPPPVPGNRSDDLRVAFDSRGAELAGWYYASAAQNGSTGRIEVATRLPGQSSWCGPETLAAHRANGFTLKLRFDGSGNGFAVWDTPASGPTGTASVWVSRYAARNDCPPTPPAPPAEEIRREEVVYLPPPPGPPTVTTVRRFVQLTLPRIARVDRRGWVRLPVRCAGEGSRCTGRLALKRRRAVWGSRAFTIARGQRVMRLRLRASARRALARRRRAAVTAELRLQGQPVKRSALALRRR